jgi:diguanylate cyclase (GGDEF)-like protein
VRSPDQGSQQPGTSGEGLSKDGVAPDGLLDALPVGIAQLDAAGRVVRVNRALADLLGSEQIGVRGRRLDDFGWRMVGDEPVGVATLLDSADAPAAVEGRVWHLVHQDGRELFVRAWPVRVSILDPEVTHIIVVTEVTTETLLTAGTTDRCEEYRSLAEGAEDVVLVHRDREITWASPSVASVLGTPPPSLIGVDLERLTHPDDVQILPVLVPDAPSATVRLRLRHADGGYRWFSATMAGQWAGRRLEAVYTCLREIGDQVRVEQRIADVQQRVRLAFDASPDGFAILEAVRDDGGTVSSLQLQFVNTAGRELLGIGEGDTVVGTDVRSLVRDVESSGLWDRMLAVLEGGALSRTRTAHGRRRTFDGYQARLDENSLVVSFRDVTDLVEGERLLTRAYEDTAEMRATLETALDATSDGFAVYALELDEGGRLEAMRVVHANAAGAASLGMDPDLMVGMEIREFFPEVVSSGLWDRIMTASLTKAPQCYRVHQVDADGEWESSWDNTVAPVGEERMTITWRNVSAEESAVRQLARTRDEAMYSATHDALTNLPNRVLLRQHLHEALRVCTPDERVGLVFVDLDKFKAINDSHGHAAGDAVLKATATRLSRLIRHGDLAARLAGDEFVLVLTKLASAWTPEPFFTRASCQLSEPVWVEAVELHPSASLGVVLADHERLPSDVDALIKEADVAMYRNKAARRRAEAS